MMKSHLRIRDFFYFSFSFFIDKKYAISRCNSTEVPDGYALHHDTKNGNLQLVKIDWHKTFTHAGGHSLFKEGWKMLISKFGTISKDVISEYEEISLQ